MQRLSFIISELLVSCYLDSLQDGHLSLSRTAAVGAEGVRLRESLLYQHTRENVEETRALVCADNFELMQHEFCGNFVLATC